MNLSQCLPLETLRLIHRPFEDRWVGEDWYAVQEREWEKKT